MKKSSDSHIAYQFHITGRQFSGPIKWIMSEELPYLSQDFLGIVRNSSFQIGAFTVYILRRSLLTKASKFWETASSVARVHTKDQNS